MPGPAFATTAPVRTARPGDLAEARRQIQAAVLDGAGQELLRARMLAFVDAHPDALDRRCPSGHLTGSALVVDDDRERVVLLHHRKLGRWLQPGGHADGNGDLAGVALEEASEEIGVTGLRLVTPAVDADIHAIPARGEDPRHEHFDLRFVVLAPPGAEPVGNHESTAVRWFQRSQLDDHGVDGELRRLIERGLAVARTV